MELITPAQQAALANAQAVIQAQLQSLPQNAKVGILVFVLAVIGTAYWFLSYSDVQIQIVAVQEEVAGLDQKIRIDEAKASRLDALKVEYAAIEHDLIRLQEELPPEEEAALLLRQISEMGRPKDLELTKWTPKGRAEHETGLYVALPVDVNMTGGYHEIATFFDQIRVLKRVVSVTGATLGGATVEDKSSGSVQVGGSASAQSGKKGMRIKASFTVTAYASPRRSQESDVPAP